MCDKVDLVDAEEYPSPAEGIGLENRQGCQNPQGFESPFLLHKFKFKFHIQRIRCGRLIKIVTISNDFFFFYPFLCRLFS